MFALSTTDKNELTAPLHPMATRKFDQKRVTSQRRTSLPTQASHKTHTSNRYHTNAQQRDEAESKGRGLADVGDGQPDGRAQHKDGEGSHRLQVPIPRADVTVLKDVAMRLLLDVFAVADDDVGSEVPTRQPD